MKVSPFLTLVSVIVFGATELNAATVIGDTQGKVEIVSLNPVINNEHKFRVHFSTVENDRWNCISGQGYIEISDSSPNVSIEQFKLIVSMALSAQATGKSLAIDSPPTNPCFSGSSAWIISD